MKSILLPATDGYARCLSSRPTRRNTFLTILFPFFLLAASAAVAITNYDVNGDGVVDAQDVNLIDQIIMGTAQPVASADVSGDGITDVYDIVLVKNYLSGISAPAATSDATKALIYIAAVDLTAKTAEVRMTSEAPVLACQFKIEGAVIQSVAEALPIYKASAARMMVLAETVIPVGDRRLALVNFEATASNICVNEEVVISELSRAKMLIEAATLTKQTCRPTAAPANGNSSTLGVSINADKSPPHATAMLDVSGIDKGILIPRMTTAQRLAILSPAHSLLVYDTNMLAYYYYCSNGWTKISSEGSGWNTTGNSGTNPAQNFMGTTDAKDLVFRTNNKEQMRILSGGNIGMGTDNPAEKLHIIGKAKADTFRLGDIGANGIYWDFQEESNNDLSVRYGTYGEYLRIKYENGFLGLGNNNPSEKLDITGNAKISGEINSAGQRSKIRFHFENLLELPDATTYHGMFSHVHDQNSAYFAHAGNWLRIINEDANGNAGIGTTLPLSKLHIKGGTGNYLLVESAAAITNFEIKSDGRVQVGAQNDDARFFASENAGFANTIKAKGTGNINAIYGFGEATVTGVRGESVGGKGIFGLSNTGNAGHFQSNTGNTLLLENSTDGIALVIPPAKGKTGIGTNAPSARLHINSGTGFDQLRLESACTACPTGSSDPRGNIGDIVWGINGSNSGSAQSFYIFIKTPQGWQRANLNKF